MLNSLKRVGRRAKWTKSKLYTRYHNHGAIQAITFLALCQKWKKKKLAFWFFFTQDHMELEIPLILPQFSWSSSKRYWVFSSSRVSRPLGLLFLFIYLFIYFVIVVVSLFTYLVSAHGYRNENRRSEHATYIDFLNSGCTLHSPV